MYALVGIIDVCCIWPDSKYMVLNPELAEYEKDMKGKGEKAPDGADTQQVPNRKNLFGTFACKVKYTKGGFMQGVKRPTRWRITI